MGGSFLDFGLGGKSVLISGGTSGIGLAASREFLAEHASVTLLGRQESRGAQAIDRLAEFPKQRMRFIAADVRNEEDCRRAVKAACDCFGGLDILINSAGIYAEGALTDMKEAKLRAILETNVMGTMLLSKAAIPALIKRKGTIVNIASDAGLHGNYFASVYCASKGAVVLFTRALALELAAKKVRVNAVAPGDILTEMTEEQLSASSLSHEEALREMASVYPLSRIGKAKEVADLIVFLASSRAAFITGSVYAIDGGLTA